MNLKTTVRNIASLLTISWAIIAGQDFIHAQGNHAMKNQPRATIEKGTVRKKIVPVKKDGQSVGLQVYDIQLNVHLSEGKLEQGEVIAVYEPNSGLFWWKYQKTQPTYNPDRIQSFFKEYGLFLTDEKIGGVLAAQQLLLSYESRERHKTFEDALNHLVSWLEENLVKRDGSRFRQTPFQHRKIDLSDVLNSDFYYVKNTAAGPRAQIVGITRNGSSWTLQLLGANKDQATIILDEEYKPQSATVNGKPIYPK